MTGRRERIRDAAPTEAGAVPGTSGASDHACFVQRVGPGQAWIATSRRGWVIAAWVLACRARFADSSVKTARDGLSDRHPRSPLRLDDSGLPCSPFYPYPDAMERPSGRQKFDAFER